MQERLETPDLFKSASLLCGGAHLLETRHDGRSFFFILSGNELFRSEVNYRSGLLKVNPLELKNQLNTLRDLIFESKRK